MAGHNQFKDIYVDPETSISITTGVEIKEVINKSERKAFFDFPYQLYKGNKYYVPQIKKDTRDTFDAKKNPAYEFCESRLWLAYKGDRVVGRIAGIINYSFIEKWKNKYTRFGWMDFEEDEAIANALLRQVEIWAREKGMTAVHGPLGFTNFDFAGLLIEGFDQEGTAATLYNYPYYALFLEKAGYTKEVDWVEYRIKLPTEIPEKLEKIAAAVQKRYDFRVVEGVRKEEVLFYAKDIFRLINSTYADLYGTIALNERQIEYNIKKYLTFIPPDFVSLVLDKNGDLAAFGVTMPSLSKALQKANGKLYPFGVLHLLRAIKNNKLADLLLVAVRKDLQGKGVNALLMLQMHRAYLKYGIEYAESNPELESNKKVQSLWDLFESVQHKRRRSFIKFI